MASIRARNFVSLFAATAMLLSSNAALAGGVAGPGEIDTAGLYLPTSGTFLLRNSNTGGAADIAADFGPNNSTPLIGDWDNDGTDSVGVYNNAVGQVFLANTNAVSAADVRFSFGSAGNPGIALAGDWDGSAGDSVGLYLPIAGRFKLKNSNSDGNADINTRFGPRGPTLVPLVGNWSGGDSVDGIGLYDPATGRFLLEDDPASTSPTADFKFRFGPTNSTLIPVVGDWNDDGTDTVGLYNPVNGRFLLRNSNTSGNSDVTFTFGGPGLTPVTGNYDGTTQAPPAS